jgi:hypothetical protein
MWEGSTRRTERSARVVVKAIYLLRKEAEKGAEKEAKTRHTIAALCWVENTPRSIPINREIASAAAESLVFWNIAIDRMWLANPRWSRFLSLMNRILE